MHEDGQGWIATGLTTEVRPKVIRSDPALIGFWECNNLSYGGTGHNARCHRNRAGHFQLANLDATDRRSLSLRQYCCSDWWELVYEPAESAFPPT